MLLLKNFLFQYLIQTNGLEPYGEKWRLCIMHYALCIIDKLLGPYIQGL